MLNPRVVCHARSISITKQTRSGPRLGNGAPVYLIEIGSMNAQPSSPRTSTTRPCSDAIRYGFSRSITDRPTRGSRCMWVAFIECVVVQSRTRSPSSPAQTTQLRGVPSRVSVERWT